MSAELERRRDDATRARCSPAARSIESLEALTLHLAGAGYPFTQVRPRLDRDPVGLTIGVTYVVDEGPRSYIERIEVRGNARTRDYVIRREFDIAEGDAFNRVLIDRAERRLRNLGYFSEVAVSTEQGSSPDRVDRGCRRRRGGHRRVLLRRRLLDRATASSATCR